jgi:sugar/nucleoside kinase (ribokinase family)
MLKSKKEIAIIGDIFCDILASGVAKIPEWEADTLSSGITILAGGSALNITVHGANCSSILEEPVKLHFFSCVGDDFQGKVCREALDHPCIDARGVLIRKEKTGTCIVLSGTNDRSFVTDRACIKKLSVTWFDQSEIFLPSVSHIHIGGFYNCNTLQTEIPAFLKNAREHNLTTSLNPQYDATGGWDGIREICPYLTLFISNEVELSSIVKLADRLGLGIGSVYFLQYKHE